MVTYNRVPPRIALLAGLLIIHAGVLAHAAKLRSTSGGRTIIRTAVYEPDPEEESVLVGGDAPTTDAAELIEPPGEILHGEPSVVEDCAVTGPCWPDMRWVGFDYLLMWQEGRPFPPLARASQTGIDTAKFIFGGRPVGGEPRGGGRLEFGVWLDPCKTLGVGAHLVALSETPSRLTVAPGDFAYLDLPFTDHRLDPPAEQSFVVASPTAQTEGSLNIASQTEITGFDVFGKTLLSDWCGYRFDMVYGYVHSRIDEDFFMDTFTAPIGGGFPTLAVSDVFQAKNEYNAGLIGLTGEHRLGAWGIEMFARFGFGSMRQTMAISGTTVSQSSAASGDTVVTSRGFLAQPTNSGVWVQDKFSFMQDIGVKLAWYPREHVKVSVGYALLYWSSVARPGRHIDTNNNSDWFPATGTPPDTPFPQFQWNPTDLFVHGLTAGMEFRF